LTVVRPKSLHENGHANKCRFTSTAPDKWKQNQIPEFDEKNICFDLKHHKKNLIANIKKASSPLPAKSRTNRNSSPFLLKFFHYYNPFEIHHYI
jgi:hypothetical protein